MVGNTTIIMNENFCVCGIYARSPQDEYYYENSKNLLVHNSCILMVTIHILEDHIYPFCTMYVHAVHICILADHGEYQKYKTTPILHNACMHMLSWMHTIVCSSSS